jgi:hypothetical protein
MQNSAQDAPEIISKGLLRRFGVLRLSSTIRDKISALGYEKERNDHDHDHSNDQVK